MSISPYKYCKTLNAHVPFLNEFRKSNKTRKIKGHEYVFSVN